MCSGSAKKYGERYPESNCTPSIWGFVAGAARKDGAVADSTTFNFHMSQNAVAYRSELGSHTLGPRSVVFRSWRQSFASPILGSARREDFGIGLYDDAPVNLFPKVRPIQWEILCRRITLKVAWSQCDAVIVKGRLLVIFLGNLVDGVSGSLPQA
jgi:hypothetical protein